MVARVVLKATLGFVPPNPRGPSGSKCLIDPRGKSLVPGRRLAWLQA